MKILVLSGPSKCGVCGEVINQCAALRSGVLF
jgi:hypothetical protein